MALVLYQDPMPDLGLGDVAELTNAKVYIRNETAQEDLRQPDERLRLRLTRTVFGAETELFDSSYGSVILGDSLSEIR